MDDGVRDGVDGHAIQLHRHRPHPALSGLVAGMVGMRERPGAAVHRRQPAGSLLPLVLSWGAPLHVSVGPDVAAGRSHAGFVAGLMPGPADTRFSGARDCVQVYLTPLGAERLLGVPGRELAGRVTDLEDVAPAFGGASRGAIGDRLGALPTWRERFRLVERALLASLPDDEPDPLVPWMWERIAASGGRLRVHELAARTGWSQRHVTARFRDTVGVPPKAAAQVVRFERALAELGRLPLAELAAVHGYADQSHLTREFARFAGASPTSLLAAAVPTPHTALGGAPR